MHLSGSDLDDSVADQSNAHASLRSAVSMQDIGGGQESVAESATFDCTYEQ